MPLSASERQRKRREKVKSNEEIFQKYKAQEKKHKQSYRQNIRNKLGKLTREEQEAYIQERREKDRERQLRCREKKAASTKSTPTNTDSPRPYSSLHQLSRARNRVKITLPKSPHKRKSVLRSLLSEFGGGNSDKIRRPRMDRISDVTVDSVKRFYEQDDISKIAPGKRDVITVRSDQGKTKLQKRHLVMSLREVHALFLESNPEAKIGSSKFCELRPTNVFLSSETPSNMCLCVYHENVFMALDTLHQYVPQIPAYSKDFPVTCLSTPREECWYGECKHELHECGFKSLHPLNIHTELQSKLVKWFVWEDTSGRLIKEEITGTLEDLYNYVVSIMPKFLKHCFIKRQQAKSYESDKTEAMKPDSKVAVLQMDYAENYTCVAQDEIQSAHWNQNQVTLYTSVLWFQGKIYSHVIVSDYLKHEKTSTVVFTDNILSSMPQNVAEVHVWTDGPTSQSKNKFVMAAMKHLAERHKVRINWNFSATSHGKGPVDGIGAALKRKATDKVKSRQCIINNAVDFYNSVQDSSVKTTLISTKDVEAHATSMKLESLFKEACQIPGITGFHFVQPGESGFITKQYTAGINHVTDDQPASSQSDFTVPGKFVAVRIPGKRQEVVYIYMAEVLQTEGTDVQLNFLKRNGSYYVWPDKRDESWQPSQDIICGMPVPETVNSRNQVSFSEESLKHSQNAVLQSWPRAVIFHFK